MEDWPACRALIAQRPSFNQGSQLVMSDMGRCSDTMSGPGFHCLLALFATACDAGGQPGMNECADLAHAVFGLRL